MKKLHVVSFVIFLLIPFSITAQWTVESLPDPIKTNSYVSNPNQILSTSEVDIINAMLRETADSSKAQIAVVMLQSIGTEVPKQFATKLFNRWGIGSSGTNNGLLILFVMDQRRIEFETGYGMEILLPDAKCYQIQQDYMVPRFKEGNFGQGMVDGVSAVYEIVMGKFAQSDTRSSTSTETYSSNEYTYEYNTSDNQNYGNPYKSWLGFYIRATLIACLLFVILFSITLFQKDYFDRYQTLRIFKLYIWFILFPIPFIFFYMLTKKLLDQWRNTPRISAKTGRVMYKLTEEDDDKYLEAGQITEEQIKSVDYDVWVSEDPDDVLILAYKRWFSKYSGCPKCKYKTYYKEYDRVIEAATYSSSGRGERKYKCMHCKHSKIETYTIPKKTKSSSSSYSSSSSRSSSSFGGSRSWGGGRSGGGGSGSSW